MKMTLLCIWFVLVVTVGPFAMAMCKTAGDADLRAKELMEKAFSTQQEECDE